MQVYEVDGMPPRSDIPQVLAIGKFDGIHIGHQAILDKARSYLKPGTRLSVMSFEPHPLYVLTGNEAYLRSLTPRSEKMRILAEYGVDGLYAVQFNRSFASTEPEVFVKTHLGRLALTQIIVGQDFRFGKGGKGDVKALTKWAFEMGVGVAQVAPVEESGTKVSSSHIRAHLAAGRVEAAEALLGRPYTLCGRVLTGEKRGRAIGFPAARLGGLEGYVLPQAGVYAVLVELPGDASASRQNWFGVFNAWHQSPANDVDLRMEVHLLGFTGDLYGKECRISFLHRIRDERAFASQEELKAQIRTDCDAARKMLGIGGRQADEAR